MSIDFTVLQWHFALLLGVYVNEVHQAFLQAITGITDASSKFSLSS